MTTPGDGLGSLRKDRYTNFSDTTFLAPSALDAIEHMGRVRFPGVIADEEPPFSNVVELYALPADMVFDAYLVGATLDNAELLAVLG